MSLAVLSTSPPEHCVGCNSGHKALFSFSLAFQPIVDVLTQSVFAYEALVRGPDNQPSKYALDQITSANLFAFDQHCRVKSIQMATELGVAQAGARLSINFIPGAVYSVSACVQKTLQTATECAFPLSALIFELTEREELLDIKHLQAIAREYRRHGFTLALDDFGAGYSGLKRLIELDVQEVKLDLCLVRDLDRDARKRRVVTSLVNLCSDLGVVVIAEAVETFGEYAALRQCGVSLMQGFLFARPMFEGLPPVIWPDAVQGPSF